MAEEITCLVALHGVVGMGHQSVQRLIDRFGTAERAVAQCTEADLRRIPGLTAEMRRGVLACRERLPWAERIAQQMARIGAKVILSGHPDYPERLRELSAPPKIPKNIKFGL